MENVGRTGERGERRGGGDEEEEEKEDKGAGVRGG